MLIRIGQFEITECWYTRNGLIYCWKCRINQCFLKTKSVSDHSASRLQTVISTVLPRMLIFTLSASLLRIERS